MKILPSLAKLPSWTTTGDLVARANLTVDYDTALPQEWVEIMIGKGFDPRGQVVWAYPRGYVCGMPAPLTADARLALSGLQEATYDE